MRFSRRLLRSAIVLAVFAGTMAVVPAWICGRGAASWYSGDLEHHRGLARTVARQIGAPLGANDYKTGSALFSGEWLFGTYLMAGIGFCQLVLEHPETAGEFIPHIERCIEELASARVREFDANSWNNDALETLENGTGHAAYLGYFNLLLGLYREIEPENRFAALHDRITAALRQRLAASRIGIIETYPNEWYPMDNAAVLASIALHRRAMDRGEDAVFNILEKNYRRHCVDPDTGLLIQALDAEGHPVDVARGSGTALAVFFLGHGCTPLARGLYDALQRELAGSVLGFGVVREYPRPQSGRGDIDSGPVVFGFGFSATGFSIGGARMFSDREFFGRLWASAHIAGAPVTVKGDPQFTTAGALGNAILLAMLTARSEGRP